MMPTSWAHTWREIHSNTIGSTTIGYILDAFYLLFLLILFPRFDLHWPVSYGFGLIGITNFTWLSGVLYLDQKNLVARVS